MSNVMSNVMSNGPTNYICVNIQEHYGMGMDKHYPVTYFRIHIAGLCTCNCMYTAVSVHANFLIQLVYYPACTALLIGYCLVQIHVQITKYSKCINTYFNNKQMYKMNLLNNFNFLIIIYS